MTATLDAVLHPVRWRILQALGRGPATVRELRRNLSDIPQATLYRQLQPLLDAGVVRIRSEEAVRGAVERTYALSGTDLRPEDFTPEDHRRAFVFLQNALLGEAEQYLARPPADPVADGLSYTRATVHLTEAEQATFFAALERTVQPYLRPRGPDSRPLALAIVTIPQSS